MVKDVLKRFSTLALAALMVLTMLPVMAMAADLSGLTDTTIGLNAGSSGTWKAIGTRITGSINGDGCNSSATTLTITNKRQIKANLLFDYEVNLNSGTVTIDGTAISTNGSFQKELGPDETVEIKLASNSSNALETTIGINNIRMIEDKSVTVTFTPAENGVYTVNGSSVAENFSLTQSSLTAFALSATPNDGYIFVGWYDKTNDKYLRGGSNADVLIPYDCEVTAKFVETGSVFGVGTEKFDDLETAVNYAVGNGISQVTLLKDHTITGNYTIPQGITLLIPFDDAGTLYTDSPAAIRTQPASKPFRTLTMAAGSSITVNGAMSIGGRYFAAGGGQQGRPTGDHGYIKMASGSSITVKNGGNLYAWGFISGDGSVTAESGATVYEFYQIADFRGGSASFRMGNKVFPFSQYFIQNIEVPLTLNAGATEKVFSGVYAMDTTNTTTINFIGSDGMFNIKSGSFTKDYDENNDRLILMVNGEAELNTLALKLAGMSVDSAEYVLPMTNNITINIDSGSVTINQDTALLAGVEVNIAEGAGLTVASGKNVYVYDADEWNAESYVCGSSKFKSVWYAPGKKYSRSNADLVDAKVTVNGTLTVNGAMYTTAGGANICSDGTGKYVQNATPGTEKVTYQYTQSGSSVTAHEITITPAKLRNADGTYFETATVKTGTTVNYYKDGGIWHVHNSVKVDAKEATCTEKGNTDGTKCSVCNKILSGVKEIPANGHTEVIRNAKPATDTEDGYTGDVYCEVCNELLRNGEVIPATHVKITWIINGVKHETVCAKGEIPVYNGETPAKPETSRFTYEFKGWDKEIVAATENAEYTAEFTAIGKNGLCIEGNDTFWIKNGVNIAFPGLIRIADENGHIHYYYFAEDGKAVKNGNYKVNKNNGLPLPEYGFAFDSDGVIVHDEDTSKNGICDGDGSKFYYIDGVKVGEGLIKVGDYYYYARTSSGEIVRNRQYWITKTNEFPIQQGIFDFDAEGRMIVTGFIHAFGATYYYDNGVLAKGFTKIGDDYYIFNASSGKMYSNAMMWVPDNEYGITGGMYEFDADGKMIRTGFITTGGYTYYYDNGVLAKGFTKIGDDYYFFNAGSGKMYRDATLWVADNAEYGFVGGMYYFGADGKMVLPDIENGKKSIVTINGKKYLTIDGAYAPTGLYEIDGNCYYVKAAGELAVGETVWVDNKNGLIPAKGDWRAFDADGKLIHTGFVTGGDGYVYHYTDDVLSLGFTCIDGEYYLFNAGSGKMYRDANMWVGPNDYGIVGGMYYFDANGKMAR